MDFLESVLNSKSGSYRDSLFHLDFSSIVIGKKASESRISRLEETDCHFSSVLGKGSEQPRPPSPCTAFLLWIIGPTLHSG